MRVSAMPTCFNGAAVLKPRRVRREVRLGISKFALQWGRGFKTAERVLHQCSQCMRHCFNGAAVLKPRREEWLEDQAQEYAASMGPRF